MSEPQSAENGLLRDVPWGDVPYDERATAEVVHDYVVVRGDLSEQYARDQLVNVIERRVAHAWDLAHDVFCPRGEFCSTHLRTGDRHLLAPRPIPPAED